MVAVAAMPPSVAALTVLTAALSDAGACGRDLLDIGCCLASSSAKAAAAAAASGATAAPLVVLPLAAALDAAPSAGPRAPSPIEIPDPRGAFTAWLRGFMALRCRTLAVRAGCRDEPTASFPNVNNSWVFSSSQQSN